MDKVARRAPDLQHPHQKRQKHIAHTKSLGIVTILYNVTMPTVSYIRLFVVIYQFRSSLSERARLMYPSILTARLTIVELDKMT